MIYLIGQLSLWLLLTAAFAALAGWAYAAQRAAPIDAKLRRDREALVRDLSRLAAGEAGASDDIGASVELDALRRQLEVRDSRIVELERLLDEARDRANEHVAQLAQMQRGLTDQREDSAEMERLRGLVAQHEEERSREVEVIAEPVEPSIDEETLALHSWRLRYFEQRVKYLEGRAAEAPLTPAIQVVAETPVAVEEPAPLLAEWRARDAEARADYLEQQVRTLAAPSEVQSDGVEEPASEEAAPFAANADVDILLRWRLLYLERRVAYLQADAARATELAAIPAPEPAPLPVFEVGPDPDRWKWRARYLEARLRHLEARPPQVVVQTMAAPVAAEPEEEPAPPPAPSATPRKPPVLTAARNGAPDDFTLIENVSALQQSTLNAIGVFHFDQIAAWAPEHVAWIDRYFRLRGRIVQEEWVEQAAELARHGVAAARRVLESEDA